jgi:hypothetical protein
MARLNLTAFALFFTAMSLGGCSTIKHYQAELPHNLEVDSKIESVEATLDIYSIGNQCDKAYLGTVALDRSIVQLGIATGQPSYLVVGFASSSFWSSSSGYISYDITLFPRNAYRYEIEVTYIDDIYNIAVYEINRLTGKIREMDDKELQNCRQ